MNAIIDAFTLYIILHICVIPLVFQKKKKKDVNKSAGLKLFSEIVQAYKLNRSSTTVCSYLYQRLVFFSSPGTLLFFLQARIGGFGYALFQYFARRI